MVNKNYIKGRRLEYEVMQELKFIGFDIIARTAGSHSPFDVIAIRSDKDTHIIKFIQCKSGKAKLSKKELQELLKLNDTFEVKSYIAVKDNGPIEYKRIGVKMVD